MKNLKLNQTFESLSNKGEMFGYNFKNSIKKASWKLISFIALIMGGAVVLVISFILGLNRIKK